MGLSGEVDFLSERATLVVVVADSVGSRFLSGFGGQVDFIRGAAIGDDGLGKPIIALPSATKKGISKIVPYINEVCCYLGRIAFLFRFSFSRKLNENVCDAQFKILNVLHTYMRA
uniref:Acetyl-CoA hydrolase/transferase C-terminal domain-containing protein n=1 Tax=Parascaris equorum TaxID=6256 RepID=A0A914S2S3_PAREQ